MSSVFLLSNMESLETTVLETIPGNLRAVSELKPGIFRHVDQLQDERQNNLGLRDEWFYTADGHGYFLREDGGVDWAIMRESENLVLRHIDDEVNSSYDQLVDTCNYFPDNAESLSAKRAKDTVVVDMSKLRLSGSDDEFRYLDIRTEDGFINTKDGYQAPNKDEQKVMSRLGYTSKNLKIMHDSKQKIEKTKIYVVNPVHVQRVLRSNPEHNSLWRASRLNYFDGNSLFVAYVRNVNINFCLRGVRRDVSPIGDAQEDASLKSAYNVLLTDPLEAVKVMNDEIAAGIAGLLQKYLSNKG